MSSTPPRDRTSRLVLKAIRSLPQREQDEVLRALIGKAIVAAPPPARSGGFRPAPEEPPLHLTDPEVIPAPPFSVTKQVNQPLLVRLPSDLHDRLRLWATEHGFSMAGIARGLIERFLDEQDRKTG
jgi:hypothetical protein